MLLLHMNKAAFCRSLNVRVKTEVKQATALATGGWIFLPRLLVRFMPAG